MDHHTVSEKCLLHNAIYVINNKNAGNGEKERKYLMRKKILSVILALAMLACMLPLGGIVAFAESSFAGGDGSESDPYQISTLEQLTALAEEVNDVTDYSGTYFILTDDIGELNDDGTVKAGLETPIGNGCCFAGNFDGDGHTVVLNMSKSSDCYFGLFGNIANGGTVSDVITAGIVSGSAGASMFGGICGYLDDGCTITGCTNKATVTGEDGACQFAGICGYNNIGTLADCKNTANITGENANTFGGICGHNYKDAVIRNCGNSGIITGSGSCYEFGGVCGHNAGTIENSANSGSVAGINASQFGGIAGANYSSVKDCCNFGSVEGVNSSSFAGISGFSGSSTADGTSGDISASVNTGSVSGDENSEDFGAVCGVFDDEIKISKKKKKNK